MMMMAYRQEHQGRKVSFSFSSHCSAHIQLHTHLWILFSIVFSTLSINKSLTPPSVGKLPVCRKFNVGVPNQSFGSWTLFLCKRFLFSGEKFRSASLQTVLSTFSCTLIYHDFVFYCSQHLNLCIYKSRTPPSASYLFVTYGHRLANFHWSEVLLWGDKSGQSGSSKPFGFL